MQEFDFGLAVRQFLDGALGKRMLDDSSHAKDAVKDALVLCDESTEEGRSTARQLRMDFHALNQWQVFFAEYIRAGDAAEAQLRELDDATFDEE
jgi:hypothetical protein